MTDLSALAPRTPRVSVVIPCYNLGAFLNEAVESVLAQTFQDFEIVVVNDGSTDLATETLLADFQRPKTRVIHAQHRGLAAARNLGVEHSTGAYLCALDADDRLVPSYLEKAVRVLDADPSITSVSSWLRTFGEESWEWKPERCDLPTLLWEDTVLTAALVRRHAVRAAGGYDMAMPVQGDEDWDLWLTLVERGARGMILPKVLFEYRRRAGSMSTVCWHGPGHLPLARYRVAKHRDAYQTYLTEVLLHQDGETAALLRQNDELERRLGSELEPAVASCRQELTALLSRLAAATAQVDGNRSTLAIADRIEALEAAVRAASNEVVALRTSKSWRLTGPFRKVYDWWLGWRGPA